jgi:hypothetical protein
VKALKLSILLLPRKLESGILKINILPEKSVKRDASNLKTFETLGILDVHF